MPHWLALHCPMIQPLDAHGASPARPAAAQPRASVGAQRSGAPARTPAPSSPEAMALGWWALQFTPKVAWLEEAVVMDVSASLRLFGGAPALYARISCELPTTSPCEVAAGPSSLAALALLRAGCRLPRSDPRPRQPASRTQHAPRTPPQPATDQAAASASLLDPLPLACLSAVAAHAPTLSRLGCQSLGQVRALPRAGLSRRFGAGLLQALDRAYGDQPESHAWISLPEVFHVQLELPGRVETAPALMFGAQRLLAQLEVWLARRHAGVHSVVLGWQHDCGPRSAGLGGELRVRTAVPTRRIDHLARLLTEQLARTHLAAPVGVITLHADEVEPLPEISAALWPGAANSPQTQHSHWTELIERLSARLGEQQVLCAEPQADYRLEAMQIWVPAQHRAPRPQTSPRPPRFQPALRPAVALSATASAAMPAHAPSQGALCAKTMTTTNSGPIHPQAHLGTDPPQPPTVPRSSSPPPSAAPFAQLGWPQPAWLLPEPRALATRQERPVYQGPLQLLAGPQRLETGWWDAAAPTSDTADATTAAAADPAAQPPDSDLSPVQRDYYIAWSPRAGLLCLYRERLPQDHGHTWFLHGFYG